MNKISGIPTVPPAGGGTKRKKSFFKGLCDYIKDQWKSNHELPRGVRFLLTCLGLCAMGVSISFTIYALICSISADSIPKEENFSIINPWDVIKLADLHLHLQGNEQVILDELRLEDSSLTSDSSGFKFLILIDYTKSTGIKMNKYPVLHDNFSDLRIKFKNDAASLQSLIAMEMLQVISKKYGEGTEVAVGLIRSSDTIVMIKPPKSDPLKYWNPLSSANLIHLRQTINSQRIDGEETDFFTINKHLTSYLKKGNRNYNVLVTIISDFAHDKGFFNTGDKTRTVKLFDEQARKFAEIGGSRLRQLKLVVLPIKDSLTNRYKYVSNSETVLDYYEDYFNSRVSISRILDWQYNEKGNLDISERIGKISVAEQIKHATLLNEPWKKEVRFYYTPSTNGIMQNMAILRIGDTSGCCISDPFQITLLPDGPYPKSMYLKCENRIAGQLKAEDKGNIYPGISNTSTIRDFRLGDTLVFQLCQAPINYIPNLSIELYNEDWKRKYRFPIQFIPHLSSSNSHILIICANTAIYLSYIGFLVLLWLMVVLIIGLCKGIAEIRQQKH